MTCTRRRLRHLTLGSIVTSLVCAAVSGGASAQEATEPPPAVAPVAPPVEPAPTEPTAAAVTVAPPSEPAPVGVPADSTPPEAETPAEAEAAPWYSAFSIGGFVDAYAALRSDKNNRPISPPPPVGGYFHEAYVQANGFALSVAGLDAAYKGDQLGATISLRFGPAISRFYAGTVPGFGIDNLSQAYVTYKPIEQLTFDFGQFATIYGAEVLESWKNVNYSRGALYYAMQPFWHQGLKANIAIASAFALNAMIVNGVNNPYENNKSPSLGLQAVITGSDVLSLAIGYLGALNPTQGANGPFQNFFDVVATITSGGFKLVLNADVNLYKPAAGEKGENFWGISVAPAYAFNDMFGIAARFEYLSDSANQWNMSKTKTPYDPAAMDGAANGEKASKAGLTTLTFTLDIKPISGVANLVLRPEFRYEIANNYYFFNKDNELTKGFWTLMLGAAVTSM